MRLNLRSLGSMLWRLAASLVVLIGIAEVGKRVAPPDPARPGPERSDKTLDSLDAPAVDDAPPISIFEMAGVPMAMTTQVVLPCNARVWSPEDMPEWTPGSWLLDIERSQDHVTAVWLEFDGAGARTLASTPGRTAVHHSAQLDCAQDGRGALHHTWITAAAGIGGHVAALKGSLVVDQGPVPLLVDCERRLRFHSLGWWIFVDEPADAASVLPRFETAMVAEGWRRHLPPPVLTSGRAAGEVFANQDFAGRSTEGLILRRGPELCLVSHTPIEGREMLIPACLGLTTNLESSQTGSTKLGSSKLRFAGNPSGGS